MTQPVLLTFSSPLSIPKALKPYVKAIYNDRDDVTPVAWGLEIVPAAAVQPYLDLLSAKDKVKDALGGLLKDIEL